MSPTPNDFRNLIISPTGNLCEKVSKLLVEFPRQFYNFISWMITEAGTPTEEFSEWICANNVECPGGEGGGSGTPNPNMPAPGGVSASDGTYSDKVRVTWNAVTPPSGTAAVTEYKLYRALSTISDPELATLIATITAPTVQYDDTTAVAGTTYNYWVVATNGTQTSNFGGPDVGNADAPTVTMPAISDLRCTKGFFRLDDGYVGLIFTPQTGATKFDVYRSTVNDFATATKIGSDKTAYDTANPPAFAVTTDTLWDNIGEYLYVDVPPSPSTIYFYWIIGKKDAPPATSPESNVDSGWVRLDTGIIPIGTSDILSGVHTAPGGADRARVVFWGGSGDGAGGGTVYGGGGGGGAGLVMATLVVVPGDDIELVASAVVVPANTAYQTSGQDGADAILELNTVEILRAIKGDGGDYTGSASGPGGPGGSTSGSVAFTGYDGADGENAPSGSGGRGGHRFGKARGPAAHYNGFAAFTTWEGNGSQGSGGSGSRPYGPAPEECDGGKGTVPTGFIVFYTA